MVRSARHCRAECAIAIVVAALVGSFQSAPAAELAPIEADQTLLSAPRQLRLEVFINGISTHYVEPFV
jgi:hypothetical protein